MAYPSLNWVHLINLAMISVTTALSHLPPLISHCLIYLVFINYGSHTASAVVLGKTLISNTVTLGARGPETSDYMLRTLRALVK